MEESLDCSFPSSSSQHSFLPHAADGPPLKGRLLQTRYGAALINSFHNFWDSSQQDWKSNSYIISFKKRTYVSEIREILLTYMEESYSNFPSSSSQLPYLPHAADGPPQKGGLLQTRYGATDKITFPKTIDIPSHSRMIPVPLYFHRAQKTTTSNKMLICNFFFLVADR